MREIMIEKACKNYGEITAVDEVNLSIGENEIFGFVGPNGAGKTTLIECILGLRKLDSGTITVFGKNSEKEHQQVICLVGAQLQECALPGNLKVKEAIQLQASAFGVKVNIDEILQKYKLLDKKNCFFSKLSGGQKQRLFILLADIHNPDILVFDELSTGLDPIARHDAWSNIRQLKNHGKTIILSTHMMDEAQEICDKVAVVNKGKLIITDTPRNLIKSIPYHYVLEFYSSDSEEELREALENIVGISGLSETSTGLHRLNIMEEKLVTTITEALDANKIQYSEIRLRMTNLEDFFHYAVSKDFIKEVNSSC